MKKADYGEIAGFYDKGRTLSESTMDLWLNLISKMSGAAKGVHVLDIGCGTGRFAIPMAEKLGYRVTGADPAQEMLVKAQHKNPGGMVTWDVQDAHRLTYPDASFDIVFMSHVLHHCENPPQIIGECWRVLVPGGILLIRHSTIEEFGDEPEGTFFPETREINAARAATQAELEILLNNAGFTEIRSEQVLQKTSESGAELVERLANKSASALTMIPEEAFQRGLERLRRYAADYPDDPWLLHDRIRLTTGRKPEKAVNPVIK